MILERGNMWDVFGNTELFLITTNPIVNGQGLAVMGRGIAKQAADRFPTIRADFAEVINNPTRVWECDVIGRYDDQLVGFFMVKDHWAAPARIDIISKSVDDLVQWIEESDNPLSRVDLNFPGIGNGGLDRELVLPIIEQLPDNVHIWEYGE
jgi:hypothetical protein